VAYVRKKRVRNKKTGKVYEYHQLVEGVWLPGGKVKQVVLAHLGEHETLEDAVHADAKDQRESLEGGGRWAKIYEDFHGRWKKALRHFPDTPYLWPQAPTVEDVIKRAYPRGWEPGSGKGGKWRKALGLPEDPGENPIRADLGEFMVDLAKFWREFERFTGEQERRRNRKHFGHVKLYIETREELERKGYSRPEAHAIAADACLKAAPDRFGQHNPLDAALLERLDTVFSHKALTVSP
jgi:hypothetical protein